MELTEPKSIIFKGDIIDQFIQKEIEQGFPGAALVVTRY
ncbi:unnamed protein product, partial [Rotaria socialis]